MRQTVEPSDRRFYLDYASSSSFGAVLALGLQSARLLCRQMGDTVLTAVVLHNAVSYRNGSSGDTARIHEHARVFRLMKR